MHIKSILAAAAIAIAATFGSASAADQFTTLEGIQAVPMNTAEMGQVRGTEILLVLDESIPGETFLDGVGITGDGGLIATRTAGVPGDPRTVPVP